MKSFDGERYRPTLLVLSHKSENVRLLASLFADTYVLKIESNFDWHADALDLCLIEPGFVATYGSRLAHRKEREPGAYLPVVGLLGAAEVSEAQVSQFDDVVRVPCTKAELIKRVENLINARRLSLNNLNLADRLEAELKVSSGHEKWLQEIFENIPTPIFVFDLKLRNLRYSNDSAREMLGFKYEDFQDAISDGMLEIRSADGKILGFAERPSQRVLNGEVIRGEEVLLAVRGVRYHIKIFASQIPAAYGQPATGIIVFQDISEIKKAEAARLAAQSELEQAVEVAQVGFWSLDLDSRRITVSSLLMHQFGVDEDHPWEHVGQALDQIDEADRGAVMAAMDRAIENDEPFHMEYRVNRPDGTSCFIEARGEVIRDDAGRATKFAGSTLDISAHVELRRALELSRAEIANERMQLDQMFTSSPAAMCTWVGEDLIFDRVNPEYQKLFPGRQLVGRALLEVCPELDGQGFDDLLREVYRTGVPHVGKEVMAKIRPADGGPLEDHYFDFTYVQLSDRDGRAVAVYDHSIDVTATVLARREVERARTAAEVANQTKSQFLANMSHEIRTPLGIIVGFSSLLKDAALGEAARAVYVDTIIRNGQALTTIIDDILDLAKVEAGKIVVETVGFALVDLLSECVDMFGDKAKQKGIDLALSIGDGIPARIKSDPTRLRQILINLIGNAIKFTEVGGVRVTALAEPAADGGRVWLNVAIKDTGIGLSREQRERLFSPFAQADETTTRKFGGTGLGLVLSRRLAEALGGVIEISSSELGVGSTFALRFPVQIALVEEAAASAIPEDGASILAGKSILVVDDSEDNLFLVGVALEKVGVRVTTAANGRGAIEACSRGAFDCVLLDIQMPEMDGFETLAAIRAQGFTPPVVALTAHAMLEERLKTRDAGFAAHVTKPIDRRALVAALAQVISQDRGG